MLEVFRFIFLIFLAVETHGGSCPDRQGGYCANARTERCARGYSQTWEGCSKGFVCCFPGLTATAAPKEKSCTDRPAGYCANTMKQERCTPGSKMTWEGCTRGFICCYSGPGETQAPTATAAPTVPTVNPSKKSCTDRPEGYCVNTIKQERCKPGSTKTTWEGCARGFVCCYSEPEATAAPTVKPPGSEPPPCGHTMANSFARIAGGEETTIREHPWQVSLNIQGSHHCGGSIISDQWILTAGHCLVHNGNWTVFKASDIKVLVGSANNKARKVARSLLLPIEKYIVHPEYTSSQLKNDITLIKLAKPLDLWGPDTRALCLPAQGQTFDNQNCVVSGWGDTTPGVFPEMLRAVEITIFSRPFCKKLDYWLQERKICGGDLTGKRATCMGDSGGPIVCRSSGGAWVQAALVSTGSKCGTDGDHLGRYTTVASFRDWVDLTIREN